MWKPQNGICIECGQQKLIVVRAGLCRWCNNEMKKNKKAARPKRESLANEPKATKEQRLKIKNKLQNDIDAIMGKGKLSTDNDIEKYKKKKVSKLIKIATFHFNLFIRNRDKHNGCISCGGEVSQAGHYLSGGHHGLQRFNPDNVHGQDVRCNLFLHGNLIEYRKGLVKKIGVQKVELLEGAAHKKHKWDKFTLIEIIFKYKSLNQK